MISTKTLLRAACVLISLDVAITLIAVGRMGAIELNPLSSLFGFYGFMVLKIVVSIVAVFVMYKYALPSAPAATRYGVGAILGFYAAVCASNMYHVVGAVT